MQSSILIVGGGTAGWMSALYLKQTLPDNTQITLVESEDIGIIGVGEGSTPYLRNFFAELAIPESEWMAATDATYKAGIRFDNWCQEAEYQSYFHPFFNEYDQQPAEMFFYNSGLKRRGAQVAAHPDLFFTAAYIADQYRSPAAEAPQRKHIDYAYHFDSVKLGRFLRTKAKAIGVNHIIANVADVQLDASGAIACVMTECGQKLVAELFIDCSGFHGLLLQKSLARPFTSYADTLFNDAAVAIQTPVATPHQYKPQTDSKALSAGWMWQIPLTSRWGNGYVYSSKYSSAQDAEQELRTALGIDKNSPVQCKHLKMKVGRVEQHWYQNCVAIGLSQGFIEPLEATALMLVQFAIRNLANALKSGATGPEDSKQYNAEMNRLFEGVKDYVSLHYLLNTRQDSQYWIDAREKALTSPRLATLLEAWDSGQDFEQALGTIKHQLLYLRPSWYCILSGMGRHPSPLHNTDKSAPVDQAINYCKHIASTHFPKLAVS